MANAEMVVIDPDGDVILLCGDQSDQSTCITIRVSSTEMRNSSPVFKAMLGLQFKEGNELASSASVKVPLPDDNSDDMVLLCKIVHAGCNDASEAKEMRFEELARFMQLCDKYACAPAVKASANGWMKTIFSTKDSFGFWDHDTRCALLEIAKKTEDLTLVHEMSKDLILESLPWYALPRHLSCLRKYVRQDLANVIEVRLYEEVARGSHPTNHKCTAVHMSSGRLLGQLFDAGLWPGPQDSEETLERLLCAFEKLKLEDAAAHVLCHAWFSKSCRAQDGNTLEGSNASYRTAAKRARDKIEARLKRTDLEGKCTDRNSWYEDEDEDEDEVASEE